MVRKWFNRNRNQKKEANIDLSDITSRFGSVAVSIRSHLCNVVARNAVGVCLAEQSGRRGKLFEHEASRALLGVGIGFSASLD